MSMTYENDQMANKTNPMVIVCDPIPFVNEDMVMKQTNL